MALITPFGVFIPTRQGLGVKNGSAWTQRFCVHLFADLLSVSVYIDVILLKPAITICKFFKKSFAGFAKLVFEFQKPEFCKDAVNYVGL